MADYVPAMRDADLPEGGMSTVDINGRHILLAKIGGQVHAVSGTCTHEEADLGLGFIIEDRVVCPLHLSQFDLKTGNVLNSPATVALESFNIKIEDGMILIET